MSTREVPGVLPAIFGVLCTSSNLYVIVLVHRLPCILDRSAAHERRDNNLIYLIVRCR
jgi:hypothetical protein